MPVSRGRNGSKKKRAKKDNRRSDGPMLLPVPDSCSCPACSGVAFDMQQVVGDLTEGAAELLEIEDPLDAEVLGSALVSMREFTEGFDESLIDELFPRLEAQPSTEAMAVLLIVAAVAEDRVRAAASAAAGRMASSGVAKPRWAAEAEEPVAVGTCWHLGDPSGVLSILACTFERAGRSHGFVVTVDHVALGAAQIALVEADGIVDTLEELCTESSADGLRLAMQQMDPADFHGRLENALAMRSAIGDDGATLSEFLATENVAEDEEEDMPDYAAMVVLLRARMKVLPPPSQENVVSPLVGSAPLDLLTQLAGIGDGPLALPSFDEPKAPLPPKRKKADGPAPIYQIKVSLRGTTPPIWRRLEVPANVSLARLHQIIQTAFDWDDTHLHVFQTQYGDFGVADPELGYRAESPVSLEQVAPGEKSKIGYTYDFGDDWEHEIVVEKLLAWEPKKEYPRCTGGRRAAPPEDCGGIYGYADLLEALADPEHPDHEDQLDWLSLDGPADFDPAAFNAHEVNQRLRTLR